MEAKQFSDTYIMANSDKFPASKIFAVKDKLENLPEDKQALVHSLNLKNPLVTLILSIFFGAFSLDRFYIGDILLGIVKFFSLFILIGFIWVFLDIFFCYKKTKVKNFNKIMRI